jgi:hypothetical protein
MNLKNKTKKNNTLFLIVTTSFIFFLFILSFTTLNNEINSITGYTIEDETFTINSIPPQTINIGENFNPIDLDYYINFTNARYSEITWSYKYNFHINIKIIENIALISHLPKDWDGSELIEFTAKDKNGYEQKKNVRFTVNPKQEGNNDPIFNDFENIQGTAGELIKIAITANDPDGDNLTYIYGKPFDDNGEWTPPLNFTNSSEIIETEIKVVDGKGGFDQEKLLVLVIAYSQEDKKQPPIFYSIIQENITQTSININIETNKLCKPKVHYNLGGDTPHTIKEIDSYNKKFNIKLENLTRYLRYFYYVTCTDENNNTGISITQSFFTKDQKKEITTIYNNFDGKTTDFTQVNDIECVNYPLLEKTSFVLINFTETCINFKGLNLDDNLIIKKNQIEFNSTNLTTLKNKSVIITFYNSTITNPIIIKKGTYCEPEVCIKRNQTENKLTYELPELDNYVAIEEFHLMVRDNSDTEKEIFDNQTLKIYIEFMYKGRVTTEFPCTLKYKIENTTITKTINQTENNKFYYEINHTKPGKINYSVNINLSSLNKEPITKNDYSITIKSSSFCGDGVCAKEENLINCPTDCSISTCKPNWVCTEWDECIDEKQTRTCEDKNNCNVSYTGETIKFCEDEIDTCFNKQKDRGEEGIDCGGPCKPCEPKEEEPINPKTPNTPNQQEPTNPKTPSTPNQQEPKEETKSYLGFIITLIILIICLSSVLGLYLYDKDLFLEWENKILNSLHLKHKSKIQPMQTPNKIQTPQSNIINRKQYTTPPKPSLTKENEKYVEKVLLGYKKGYDAKKIAIAFSKEGLTKERIKKIFEEVKFKIQYEKQISIICTHLTRTNLSNIMNIKRLLDQNKYPKHLMLESLKRVIIKKYPPNISHEILNQIKRL